MFHSDNCCTLSHPLKCQEKEDQAIVSKNAIQMKYALFLGVDEHVTEKSFGSYPQ